jgi:hypothetical protein
MYYYYGLAARLRQKFGERVQKVPLDAGFSCPNRDGKISANGCIFCNPEGSGSGMLSEGIPLSEQWNLWIEKISKRYSARLFLAYLQSYSNTYGPLEKLKSVLDEISQLEGIAGLCLGTRPDCIDSDKLKAIKDTGLSEIWLDLGLQSSNDETLKKINRGHDSAAFAKSVELAHSHGLEVCAHVIAGLPGEDEEDFIKSVRFINTLPVSGIKFHNLYVCKNTTLEKMYRAGSYEPWTRERYVQAFVRAITFLRQDIVVHRISADPVPGELVSPDWSEDKRITHLAINENMEKNDLWQGCALKGSRSQPPDWFWPESFPPKMIINKTGF